MSIKGLMEAECPGCGESEQIEFWSFVRGDADEALKDALLAGELNLMLCEHCGRAFFPEATVVYFDRKADLLAFVFPESYRKEADRWRAKMHEDYRALRKALGSKLEIKSEPLLFFGLDDLRTILRGEEDIEDEVRITETLTGGLGLSLYPVDRAFARIRGLPWKLPFSREKKGGRISREKALRGVKALLGANSRLESYRRWLDHLGSSPSLPPREGKRKK